MLERGQERIDEAMRQARAAEETRTALRSLYLRCKPQGLEGLMWAKRK